jgi:chemotaxis-related protein WspD
MTNKYNLAAANKLLDRIPDKEYVDEWTSLIQKEKLTEEIVSEHSVVIFRLNREWLAISTLIFAEVATRRKFHHLPHRSGHILQGIVNLRGQLRLCISLTNLLEIESANDKKEPSYNERYHRMMAVKKEDMQWIFPVDEVYGIFRCDISQLQNVPVTIMKSNANYLKGVFAWEGKSVGYLDEDLLFSHLQRSVL